MTILDVTNGITLKLKENFPDVPVYIDELPEGFEEPCLFVKLIVAYNKPVMCRYFQQELHYSIKYFPESEEKANVENQRAAQILQFALEVLPTADGTVLGRYMRSEIDLSVLHFYITYRFRVHFKEEPIPKMMTLDNTTYLKG